MRAALFDRFGGPIEVTDLPEPALPDDGVIVEVAANGICRSDWHGWQGHDADVRLPHVPGHEFAGRIVAVGHAVSRFKVGDRVVVPFVLACGHCPMCARGEQQVCSDQRQPGFNLWGAFAERVAVPRADGNLVPLPASIDVVAAASLGCRFATAFRATVDRARLAPGAWLAIHGAGGVGLACLMIARAIGARTILVDIDPAKLALASQFGATHTLNARTVDDVPAAIRDLTDGGADASFDALGARETCRNSILGLRRRGRHVQIGLLVGSEQDPPLPMDRVIGYELELYGTHGMAAHAYPQMLGLIAAGRLDPLALVSERLDLEAGARALMAMDSFAGHGIRVITF
ncbi:MAG: zinc-dependent alcohol dehydrogenase family protein [Geminicoccaceae bacterium]